MFLTFRPFSLSHSDVLHPNRANVSKDELREKLADLYKSSKDQVSVFGFRTHYGGGKSTGFALIYDSSEALKKFEPKYRLIRIGAATKAERASRQQRMCFQISFTWRFPFTILSSSFPFSSICICAPVRLRWIKWLCGTTAEHIRQTDTHTQSTQHRWMDRLTMDAFAFPTYRQTKEEQVEEVPRYRQDQGSQEEQELRLNDELKSDAGAVVCREGGVMMLMRMTAAEIETVMTRLCGLLLLRHREIQSP